MKPDDASLTPQQYASVRAEAERALRKADALGRFPTPVGDVITAAGLEEIHEDVLNESFLAGMRRKAGNALKSALSKVIGLFDAKERLVFIDRTLHVTKQAFVRLHEVGHGFMRWQRDLYAVVEDCAQTIEPETADLFDREANNFASEVLFQLDTFEREAGDHAFGILVPVRLSKKYGASIYASVRRYVSRNDRACVVLVLNPPELVPGDGFRASLRRVVPSPRFARMFGPVSWPRFFTPDDDIGAMVPVGKRRMSRQRPISVSDQNGDCHECIAEAFTQGHQVFVLIHVAEALTHSVEILPAR